MERRGGGGVRTGRVQIIVDGRTWLDAECHSRSLRLGAGDVSSVRFTASLTQDDQPSPELESGPDEFHPDTTHNPEDRA